MVQSGVGSLYPNPGCRPGKTYICYSKTWSVAVSGGGGSGEILSLSLQQTLINTELMELRQTQTRDFSNRVLSISSNDEPFVYCSLETFSTAEIELKWWLGYKNKPVTFLEVIYAETVYK